MRRRVRRSLGGRPIGGRSFGQPTAGVGGGGASGPPAPIFDFNPLTARLLWTGDSITALEDDTGYIYWGSALSGAPMYMPPGGDHGVSGSEINEGVVASNVSDLLYPTRKQVFEDAVGSGDVAEIMIGTNSIANSPVSELVIAGLTQLYAGLLAKGAFILAHTILPSASNLGGGAVTGLLQVNAWINALPITGITYLGATYPGNRFAVVDGYTAWGGTYVGHTDSGNLHPNTNGAIKIGRAKRAALKALGRAYCPLMYGTVQPTGQLLTNASLSGSAGTFTGAGNTLVNNGVPTGVVITVTASANLTVQVDTVASHSPTDSIYSGVAAFPVVKVTVTGTAALQADLVITMGQSITSEPAGSAYEGSAYIKWKGVGATADPSGLFAMGYSSGSVSKWATAVSSTATNFTDVTLGDEGVFRGRSVPAVQVFGGPSNALTCRVRSGQVASFEIYIGQFLALKTERVAYAIPKSVNTDQDGIGGGRATGPQVGSSNTTWTATDGVASTGRPGLSWRGGNLTFQYTWLRLRSAVETVLAGPTTVTTTLATTQFTPSSSLTGDQYRLKVTATNGISSADAYSVYSVAMP